MVTMQEKKTYCQIVITVNDFDGADVLTTSGDGPASGKTWDANAQEMWFVDDGNW